MPPLRYFSPEEVAGLDPRLAKMLDQARGFAKVPFIITSGLRSSTENIAAGGVDRSSHVLGLAVDLRCASSHARMRMVTALLLVGFRRIGVYDRHIHADIDPSLPQDVIWVGTSH